MFFFFQAEDGIRDLVRSRGLGDVYKRQGEPDQKNDGDQKAHPAQRQVAQRAPRRLGAFATAFAAEQRVEPLAEVWLLYTSDAADERSSVDLGGRRII